MKNVLNATELTSLQKLKQELLISTIPRNDGI